MDVYERLAELTIILPPPPQKGGLYTPVKLFAKNLAYVSGCGPNSGGETFAGKLGQDFTTGQGYDLARLCMLNVLSALQDTIGDLNRVRCAVKVLTFVSSVDTFFEQPQVANGGTKLLQDIFGAENGLPSRSAIGVNVLPQDIPVETEALFELKE